MGLNPQSSELYQILKQFINDNGGYNKLAHTLECEWIKSFLPDRRFGGERPFHKWTPEEDQVLIDNYHNNQTKQLAILVNRSYAATEQRIKRLQDQHKLNRKRYAKK